MTTAGSLALWESRIESRKHSGLNVNQWCEQNHISKYTYYYWNRKVNDTKQAHGNVFSEVLLDTTVSQEKSGDSELVIAWNNFTITFTNHQSVPMAADLLFRLARQC